MPHRHLPEQSFAAIAVDLHLYADSARQAADAGEVMLARGGWAAPGLTHTMKELREAAEMAGRVQALFLALAPHEQMVRDFIAGLSEIEQIRKTA